MLTSIDDENISLYNREIAKERENRYNSHVLKRSHVLSS